MAKNIQWTAPTTPTRQQSNIFIFFIAYDAHKAKQIYNEFGGEVSENGLAIMGALNLYLDFINVFIYLLEIFGFSSDNR